MQPHEERVVAERDDLKRKLERLEAFLHSPRINDIDQQEAHRLRRQAEVMSEYLGILNSRIEHFST